MRAVRVGQPAFVWIRRAFVLLTFFSLMNPLPASAVAPLRPNIVYILADDLGYGDVSCLNPRSAWQTPNLDRLAREGMTFTDAHSASSLCTPSRYALLTGRYAWRGPLKKGVLRGYDRPLIEPGRMTVASLLRDQGYVTAVFGKWHLGLEWARTGPKPEDVDFDRPIGGGPLAYGFDRFFGISASLDMPPYVWLSQDRVTALPTGQIGDSPTPKLWRAGVIAPDFRMEEVQPTLIEKTQAFFAERAAAKDMRPFFLYLPLASPHTPVLPTGGFVGRTKTTPYGDFVTQVDADVGRLLAELERQGLAGNTLVVFTSDNGFAPAANVPDLTPFGHDPSAGYRGVKSDLFEGGHRIPFFARWPGVVAAGSRCDDVVGQLDLLATCADFLGVKLPDDAGEDSESLLPRFRRDSRRVTGTRPALVNHSENGSFAIRQGRWKLLLCPDSGGWSFPTSSPSPWLRPVADSLEGLPPFQLYDLEVDPTESKNLAMSHPEVVQRLGRLMRELVEQGRSTPGKAQPLSRDGVWPQIGWMSAFSP